MPRNIVASIRRLIEDAPPPYEEACTHIVEEKKPHWAVRVFRRVRAALKNRMKPRGSPAQKQRTVVLRSQHEEPLTQGLTKRAQIHRKLVQEQRERAATHWSRVPDREQSVQRRAQSTLSMFEYLKPAEICNPDFVLCAICETFHGRPTGRCRFNIGGDECPVNDQRILLSRWEPLWWWQAHLIVRGQRLSPAHGWGVGANIGGLQHRGWQHKGDVKIVDGRLLVKITAVKKLRLDVIDQGLSNAPQCIHTVRSKKLQVVLRRALLAFMTAGATDPYKSPLYRCISCPSELRIQVVESKAAYENGNVTSNIGQYLLSVNKYTDIGECDSPASRAWQSLITPTSTPKVMEPYILDVPGTIESRYEGLAGTTATQKNSKVEAF